jgi:flagellar biosynthetic protein FliR
MESLGDIGPGQSWVVATLLMSARLGAVFLLAPPFSAAHIPPPVRVAIVLALSAMLAHLVALPLAGAPTLGFLVSEFATEVALGATMAFGIILAFSAFNVAGRLLDVQIGFGIGQVLDPLTQQQLPVLSSSFNWLAMVVFFTSDAHHLLLRGLVLSLEAFPLGHAWPPGQLIGPLLRQVAACFSLGFAMVAPVVLCLFLVELSLGILSRNMPQMNMFALAIPVKVLVGITALGFTAVGMADVIARINGSIFKAWEAAFR